MELKERGYPTPAWLAAGVTDQGLPYQLQEFVAGSPLPVLDERAADLLLELIDRQAGMDPDPGRNWSEYARGVVFGDGRQRLRTSGEAAPRSSMRSIGCVDPWPASSFRPATWFMETSPSTTSWCSTVECQELSTLKRSAASFPA